MIKIYGAATSRALRPLWLLEELGITYEHVPLDFRSDDLRGAEYLALNPNGRIPTMVDGDLVLFESMAINLYIAQKYGAERLYPDNEADVARAIQWSFWVMTEVEQSLLGVMLRARSKGGSPEGRAWDRLRRPFSVIDAALDERDYLLGKKFTLADLNTAAVFSWSRPARLRLDEWPHLKSWLARCMQRPAFTRVLQRGPMRKG